MSLTPIPGLTSRGVVGKWLASQAAAGALLTVDSNGDVLPATSSQVQTAADLPSALAPYATTAYVVAGFAPLAHIHAIADVTGLQAALDARQPLDSDLTAIAALTTTAFGRSLLTQADAAATRTTIGLGTGDSPTFAGATFTNNVSVTGGGLRVTANSLWLGSFFVHVTSAADIVEINNGTLGQFRDLRLRNLTASGTVTAPGIIPSSAVLEVSNSTWGTWLRGTQRFAGDFFVSAGGLIPIWMVGGNGLNTRLGMSSTTVLAFTDNFNSGGSGFDAGLGRASAGVVEINNGTTGTLRDLSLRNLTASATVTCGGGLNLASRTKTAILASSPATNAGRFQLSDSGLVGREVYPDGTNWRYASDDSIVT